MNSISNEVLYAVLFAVVLLFQYLMKRFGPQKPNEPPKEEQLAQIPEEVEAAPAPSTAAPAFVDQGFGRSQARNPRPRPEVSRRRFTRNALMGSRQRMQEAVVIAVILGPCRAYEPHDIR